jgi:hypothetical protein
MPQVTLSVPSRKMPMLRNILKAIGMEDKILPSSKQHFNTANAKPRTDERQSLFSSYANWEFFRNELEFE